jgi:hypothetical protein
MKNTEAEQMLNSQKTILNKINTDKKQLLLFCSDDIDKYAHLKTKLGWVDTDKIIDDSLRKVIELEDVQSKVVSSNIFTMDSIMKYCINNNYVLCSITEYKGQLSEELLEAIDNYATSKGLSLSSGAELDCLYLLCPLKDIKDNSDNIKKSKRYKKSTLSKILLLEKVTDRRTHSEDYYNLIFEIGTKKPITNLINSIFRTYTKSGNLLNNSIFYTSVFIILAIIGMFFKSVDYSWYFLPVTGIVITIILIFKVFLDSYHGSNRSYQDFPHVNVFADRDFYYTDTNREITQRYSFAWLYKKYNRDDFDIMQYKNLVMKKFYLSALILIFTSFIIMSLFIRINKILVLNKANVVIIYDGVNDKEEPISIHRNYYKTGFLTYDMNKTTLLMTTEAVDKRRKEEYDRTHKK